MRKNHQEQTTMDLRTAFEAGRLSAYFDQDGRTTNRLCSSRESKNQSQEWDAKGEEWHH